MQQSIDISGALDGLRADREALLELAWSLEPDQWEAPSGCAGWSTKDVISHMAALFYSAVDASVLPATDGLGVEEAAALIVDSRRAMTPKEVFEDYEAVSAKAFDALAFIATLDVDIPFSAFESHPAATVPLAFCFDHYTHIRSDLFAPRGSLEGPPPPADALRLAPTLEWIQVALPSQNMAISARLPGRLDLIVDGPAARTITVGDGDGEAAATVRCDGDGLVRWVTHRASWEDVGAEAAGSPGALELARELHVF
jgi:uncharacterized protein (TIGR03083 family)